MEEYKEEEGFRICSRPVPSPYSRRPQTLPHLFSERRLHFPRGRVHYSNSAELRRKAAINCEIDGALLKDENHFPLGYGTRPSGSCWTGDADFSDLSLARSTVDSFGADLHGRLGNACLQTFDGRHRKGAVQMIGKSSLTEASNLANIRNQASHSEEWDNGVEGTNSKRETERKVASQSSLRKVKSVGDFETRRREHRSRLLTGPVEKILHWFKLTNHFHLLFEVIAFLVDIKQGKLPTEKHLVLRDDNSGPSLSAVFYEIDRQLPPLSIGSMVKCVGRMTSGKSFQAFKVEQSSEREKNESQRLFFMSNLVAEQAKANFTRK